MTGRVSYTTNEFALIRSILQATLKTKLSPGCFPNTTKFALITISGAPRIVKHYFKKNVTGLQVLYGIYLAGFENKNCDLFNQKKAKTTVLIGPKSLKTLQRRKMEG